MDPLTGQLQRMAVDSSGERALAVFLEHNSSSEQIKRDICGLRAYVPGAVPMLHNFMARQAAIAELEKELCAATRSHHMLALVCTETRRALLHLPAASDMSRSHRRIESCEAAITTQLRRLMCLMVRYGCGDDTIGVHRSTYGATDNPRQQTLDLLETLQQGLNIYTRGLDDNGNFMYPLKYYSVRDLLTIVDVVPQLPLPVDDTHRRELRQQCELVAKLARDYYDWYGVENRYGRTFRAIHAFMYVHGGILVNTDIFDMQ